MRLASRWLPTPWGSWLFRLAFLELFFFLDGLHPKASRNSPQCRKTGKFENRLLFENLVSSSKYGLVGQCNWFYPRCSMQFCPVSEQRFGISIKSSVRSRYPLCFFTYTCWFLTYNRIPSAGVDYFVPLFACKFFPKLLNYARKCSYSLVSCYCLLLKKHSLKDSSFLIKKMENGFTLETPERRRRSHPGWQFLFRTTWF